MFCIKDVRMLLIQNIGVSYEIVNLYKTINPPVTTYQGNSRQLPVLSYRNHVAYPTVLLLSHTFRISAKAAFTPTG